MSFLIRGIVFIVLMFLLNCSKTATTPDEMPEPEKFGKAQYSATISLNFSDLIASGKMIVSGVDIDSITVPLSINGTIISTSIADIPVGNNRKFEVLVFDDQEVNTLYGISVTNVAEDDSLVIDISPELVVNYALNFDGQNDWATVPDHNDFDFGTSDFTISAWIKTSRRNVQQQIIRKGLNNRTSGEGRWVFKLNAANRVHVVIDDNQNSGGTTFAAEGITDVADNQWHHIAAVFDRDIDLRIYVDGILDLVDTALPSNAGQIVMSDESPVLIGCDADNQLNFDGSIDDIRVWVVAKTAQEIGSERLVRLNGNEANLIANWHMEQSSGQVLDDISAKHNGALGSSLSIDQNDPEWQTVALLFP